MDLKEKIRTMREIRKWSQEEMAEKMNMSLNGYARIERGETKLSLEKLEQIANIFNMDALEFMQTANSGTYFILNESGDNNNSVTYYGNNELSAVEIEKLKLIIQNKDNLILFKDELIKNKDDLLAQKQNEIESLKEIIRLLKAKN
ncbi:helix-turn-helix domain-containing protein [Rodentibacter pneumotropicus]|uniref:XRE family transcriptional regulator n=1 Tax=Rodentibacter pneumotropicus TaxID=758 RepID=A0A4S2PXY6_9PAST|nr:helix-turn-helix transcriptional regulator [Rodentibacter pneumotropicus]THA00772.1 XRE family transcriptional regulator [Rodentibacter pneumotropicus]THA03608.1 XRE family transcriptional regulator [Rodentibacter pneumotropicus]THA08594.1 XRE family transcriptional regulator [Rodentibacter pneumotropicus]THA15952.1 XRE family transcriptional regulator [Rodentibacter pneumotropicus]